MKDKIDTDTKVLGLIGNPVEDSLSPKLQNRAIDELGLNYRYFAFPVEEGSVKEAVTGARALGLKGLNVTVPHKEKTAELADELTDAAEAIGAVNTVLFRENGGILGDNTDWTGFLESLKLRDSNPEGQSCLVFGAGGGARGVVYGLIQGGAKEIMVANRTYERAKKLVKDMKDLEADAELAARSLDEEELEGSVEAADLIVNATSVGMGDSRGKSIWNRTECFQAGQLVYDLIYNPRPTKFLKLAGGQGAETVGGLDMLILQGLASLKKWTGKEFSAGELLTVLRKELSGLCNSR